MRKQYQKALKKYFYDDLVRTRTKLKYTQAQMAAVLVMDDRSYVELDHGNSCCSALTLALYLIYCCENPTAFLAGLRKAIEEVMDNAA
ncbi:MAG: hypothetical protein IJ300_08550 [Clostridia bacterium]|nr:hypothetical protein [Clostridia bacterium]